jgi:HK97 gp10 family phage protein
MANKHGTVQLEGMADVLRDLRKLKEVDTLNAIKAANKEAAELVAEQGRVEVPKKTGRLAGSIKASATQSSASVKAGSVKRVPYAGVIHFGWMRRHIRPRPFLYNALDKRIQEVYAAYNKQIDKAIERFNGG